MTKTMRAHLLFSFSLAFSLLFCCSAYSQIKKDSSYFPLAIGNQWIYNSVVTSSVDTEAVVDTQRVNGKLYYGIAINSPTLRFWLRKDSEKVYIAPTLTIQPDSTDIEENMIYDFSADVNKKWSIKLTFKDLWLNCDYNGEITLRSKDETVATSSGVYRNCFAFLHNPPCIDAGRNMEWFARGVGRVFYYQDNIWGPNGFGLTKSNLLTSVSNQNHSPSVSTYQLFQNYPNPFNPSTDINFQLPERSYVVLDIYDALGRKITTLVNSYLNSGYHSVVWNASKQTSGVYFCRIHAKNFEQAIKLVILR